MADNQNLDIVCSECEGQFQVKHNMEGLEYEPMFCIFCGYTLHDDDIEEK
jgi:hypothetical protein